ncbi:MAG TPA: ComEA family DNA-binding protein [Clostridia bacterium]|nr:ComEA family DNA-binding protein [Clostridia bacterium]
MTRFSRKGQLVIIILAAAIFFCGGYQYSQARHSQDNREVIISGGSHLDTADSGEAGESELVIHVAGEVTKPGIYQLSEGTRVIDAINKAVPTEDADLDQLNLAAHLMDEQKIYVPPKRIDVDPSNQAAGYAQLSEGKSAITGLININTASASEFEFLPGIGPVLAERIVQYRENNGSFASPEDILNVSGIGNTRFNEIKELISIY